MTAQLKVFALTGGIGSGKSTVAGFWREAGLPVVEADQLARVAVQKGSTTLLELQRVFGAEMLLPDGNLDRKALGGLVFADPVAREQLNAIVHPEVQRLAQRRFAELSASGEELAAYEIPLLFETGSKLGSDRWWWSARLYPCSWRAPRAATVSRMLRFPREFRRNFHYNPRLQEPTT